MKTTQKINPDHKKCLWDLQERAYIYPTSRNIASFRSRLTSLFRFCLMPKPMYEKFIRLCDELDEYKEESKTRKLYMLGVTRSGRYIGPDDNLEETDDDR